ncbi:hypothetical protein LTR35_017512 [Friedmanniomyces endolithicus]|nr:hypothetical protein LTR35_017512 [Friedmanniomyces endolithicus]KAK0270452.1 hypothetical protein LTS00_016955 [Friedmanniomyces endolithicus]KAK0972582.1 hypothetical protein LTR54_017532 [Friedmanniomyces endolithicus]
MHVYAIAEYYDVTRLEDLAAASYLAVARDFIEVIQALCKEVFSRNAAMSKPSLVLVHGSWHNPQHFELLIPFLLNQSYKVRAVSLPSSQPLDTPPHDLADDTATVREAVVAELDHSNNVVVVTHSYGGCPSNNALKGLDPKSRKAAGATSAVTAIVFLCAIPIPTGTSFLDAMGGKPMAIHDFSKSERFAIVGPPGPEYYCYNDLPADQAKKYSELLRPQAWVAYEQETSYAAYGDIPAWYLYCTEDQALPLAMQRVLVRGMEEAGAIVKTETVKSGHSPFLSVPEKTAEFIMRAAEESVKAE